MTHVVTVALNVQVALSVLHFVQPRVQTSEVFVRIILTRFVVADR